MKFKHSHWILGVVVILLIAGAIGLSSRFPQTTAADPSLRQVLNPASINAASGSQQADTGDPIYPVVVNLADIPPNVYDPNNMYDRWLRGEIDLREKEYRASEQEVSELQADALSLPASSAVQLIASGPGLSAPTPGTAFDSLDINDCCGGGSVVPPDPEMSAGPNHLIAVVNLALEIYDKTGTTVSGPTTLASFFGPLGGACASGPFDPNTVYDEETDRYIIAADGDGTHYCIAVSQTSDPTGAYNMYAVPAQPVGGEFHDYPHTGVGDSYIVVGGNQFGGGIPGGFEGRVWALDKAVMYAGGALTPITFSTGGIEGTPQPLHLHGFNQGTWPSFGATHYFATDPYDGCTLNIWEWNIPAAPSIVSTLDLCTATGVTGGFPVDFPQSGGSPIQANDWRMRGFEYRNGSGWITDSISCNPGAGTVDCVRWDEVDLSGTPSLVQAGVFASDSDYRTFPDLAVNHCEDMAIGYTKSSTSIFPAVWYTGRESGDPAGTLQAEALLKAGEIAYLAFDGTPYRWGDYTGMTIDPDGTTFWYLGEYSKITGNPNGRWGTYIGSFTYPSCTVSADPDIVVSPSEFDVNQAVSTTVTHTLTISNVGTANLDWAVFEDNGAAPITPAVPTGDPAVSAAAAAEKVGAEAPAAPLSADSTVLWQVPEVVLYDNGPLVNCAGCGSGGADESQLQTALGMTVYGFGHQISANNRVADDFTITDPGGWTIDTITFFAYQTGSGTTSTINNVNLQIWDGPPNGGGTIIFGDTTTNVLLSSSFSNIYRVLDTTSGDTARPVMANVVNVGGLYLPAGTYWLDWQTGGTLASGPWAPPITINGLTTTGNGLQSLAGVWGALTDVGPQGLPFVIDGSISGAVCAAPDDIPWADVSPIAGTTAAGGSSTLDVTFDTTGLAAGNTYTGTLCITSNDPDSPLVTVPLTLTVEAQVFGVDLSSDQADSALPGETVTYTLDITNTGNTADTFDISVASGWATTQSDTSVSLAAGDATTITVAVEVPAGALAGENDVATVTATSQSDVSATDSADLTTIALAVYGVALSADQSDSGAPGDTVSYVVTITNTGNTTDTFDLSATGVWTATTSAPSVTLGAGDSTTFTVDVEIPSDAADNDSDVTTVTATSQNDATATDSAALTTTAISGYEVFLPIMLRAPEASQMIVSVRS